ncbi:MAG: hypothetical protein MRZ90_03290 [Candidatus Gastranaerophilales bacterium]|nr:hypothetical protein [Candidatus Gastranaerophilales bacterium]
MLTEFCVAKPISGQISYENVINEFMGAWEVTSMQTYSSDEEYKTSINIDFWTLEKNDNTITLKNPLSNAIASITIDEVVDKTLKFKKISNENLEKVTEMPTITLNGNTFVGHDTIIIEKYDKDGNVSNKSKVEFKLYGVKIKD